MADGYIYYSFISLGGGTDTMKIYASVLYVIDEDHYFISFTVYGRHGNHQIFMYIYSSTVY